MLAYLGLLWGLLSLVLLSFAHDTAGKNIKVKETGITRLAVVDMKSFTQEDARTLMTTVANNQVDLLGILHYSTGDPKVASLIGFDLQRHQYHAEVEEKHDVLLASPRRFLRMRVGFLIFQTDLGRQILVGGHGSIEGAYIARMVLEKAAYEFMVAQRQTVDPDYIFFELDSESRPSMVYPTYMQAAVKAKGDLSDPRFKSMDLKLPSVSQAMRRNALKDAISEYFWWILAAILLAIGLLLFIVICPRSRD